MSFNFRYANIHRLESEKSESSSGYWQHYELFFARWCVAINFHLFTFKQEIDHFCLQQFAVLGIHHVEFFLIDQHCLFVLPLSPCLFRDVVDEKENMNKLEKKAKR